MIARRLLGVLLASTVAGCRSSAPAASAHGANLILISIDTLRSDRLPAYGYTEVATPHLDALAADAVTFERAYSHYPMTLPSHASIFTGLLPPAHGVRDNKGYVLADEQVTLAERLRDAGYHTAGVVSSMVIDRRSGIAQGFEEFDDPQQDAGRQDSRVFRQRPGSRALAIAEAWLDRAPKHRPLFLFVHLFEPHTPREAPEPFASRYPDAYDAEVAWVDSLVGEFLASLERRGLYDPALIVLLSDHGEGLGDHVEREHGLTLYREALQVPLFLKLPRQQRAGERIRTPAGLIDVAPTVLALLGVDHDGLPGAALLAQAPPEDRPLYAETYFTRYQYGWSELKSVIAADAHYIEAPRPELFDLRRDPQETHNLLPGKTPPPALRQALSGVQEGRRTTRDVSREEIEQLAALGYVGGAGEKPLGDRPDPKDHIAEVMEMWDLIWKLGSDDTLEPERRIAEILRKQDLRPEPISRNVATNMLEGGQPQAASEVMAPFAESEDPRSQVLLGEIAAAQGRLPEAEARFRRALPGDDTGRAAMGLGIAALSRGQARAAGPWLERALAADDRLAAAWNALGVVRAQSGDTQGAIEAWRKAVASDSSLGDAWFNLALALEARGDRGGAVQALERYAPLAKGRDRARAEALLARLRG